MSTLGPIAALPLSPSASPLVNASSLCDTRRSIRICLLLVGILAMSLGDLYMTLAYVSSVGMMELNPLARAVMSFNSPELLAVWKVASVVLTCSILYHTRHTRISETASWCCFLILTWLTLHWVNYSAEVAAITPHLPLLAQGGDPRWVIIQP